MSLQVLEGLQEQSSDEQIAYSITTTNWTATPAGATAAAYNDLTNEDVTTTVFPANSPTILGDVITLSLLRNLSKNNIYRIEVKFTSGGNTFECYFKVRCTM
jgi:hypothetical protein